ncbi:hypothetical protein SDC9_183886 [bioreactor metagenome]|uniref:Uncharacterized protein n=1 Tax=bioreactor metagenome TaxID=1076179 RepID=A0A645HBH3_9ZZZZ
MSEGYPDFDMEGTSKIAKDDQRVVFENTEV